MLVYLKHGGGGEALILYTSKGHAHMSCAIDSSSDLDYGVKWGACQSWQEDICAAASHCTLHNLTFWENFTPASSHLHAWCSHILHGLL